MMVHESDTEGALEKTRSSLYRLVKPTRRRFSLPGAPEGTIPHEWEDTEKVLPRVSFEAPKHVRYATVFFGVAATFFVVALLTVGFLISSGGNSVSADKISVAIQGPTVITGGDTVPLSITITNKNPTTLENATLEIAFPDGTRSATDVLSAYPRYIEKVGAIQSGATVTRSVKAVVFGAAGKSLILPVTLTYGTSNSNSIFQKKVSYTLAISSSPLSISVESLSETVSGEPITFALTVRSNATTPIGNVVVIPTLPFGFTPTDSSIPLTAGKIFVGTLAPGTSKSITLRGALVGQGTEQRVFRFSVGTAKSPEDTSAAVVYMTQDATIALTHPFITTRLTVNGNEADTIVLSPGATQNVTLSYENTLETIVTNASVTVALSGTAIDYDSVKSSNGFYDSNTHTILFNRDTDESLATLAPGDTGIGNFTFSTLSEGVSSPTVSFGISIAGTRTGQSNVPERIRSSLTKTVKIATKVACDAFAAHPLGSLGVEGPIPPKVGQQTTYAIVWNIQNPGNVIAGGVMTATLPTYVTYTGKVSGSGFSYNNTSRTVTWTLGDLAQGAQVQGVFEVALTPSSSQRGSVISLTGETTFSGHDRFAGVAVGARVSPATTEARGGSGYSGVGGVVQ